MTTPEEKAQNAIIWIDQLAKTDLKQAKGELGEKNTGFCCLGLGCYLLKINYDPSDPANTEFQKSVGLSFESGKLKSSKYFDIDSSIELESLTELNDEACFSFAQISEEIKKNLKQLFIPSVSKILIEHYSKHRQP